MQRTTAVGLDNLGPLLGWDGWWHCERISGVLVDSSTNCCVQDEYEEGAKDRRNESEQLVYVLFYLLDSPKTVLTFDLHPFIHLAIQPSTTSYCGAGTASVVLRLLRGVGPLVVAICFFFF